MMLPVLQPLNCIWLLLPIIVWNAVFTSRLSQEGFKSDAGVPKPVLLTETVLRIAVFVWPLFLPLRWREPPSLAGWLLFAAGTLIYFASWLPLIYRPEAAWSKSAAGLLAPAYTPLLWLVGIAVIGGSWPYALLSLLFVAVHVYHNILANILLPSRINQSKQ